MSEYTIDVNGKRYSLSNEFKESLERRAKLEYEGNPEFSCWWMVATESGDYLSRDDHKAGDPVLVIDTVGAMVPWDRIDQLEMRMDREPHTGSRQQDGPDETEDVDAGNGMSEVKPSDDEPTEPDPKPRDVNFGRTHFGLTPHRFEEVPEPGGHDPNKIPQKPDKIDEEMMVMWVPRHPDIDVTWGAGEAITAMANRVEWNVQKKADQPRPARDKHNSHDAFESLCLIHDCEKVGEYTPSNDISEKVSGQVKRKGEDWYDGDVVGDRWSI